MKHPSSGLSVGLWVVGGIVAVYVATFVLFRIDIARGHGFYRSLSWQTQDRLEIFYKPLVKLAGIFGL